MPSNDDRLREEERVREILRLQSDEDRRKQREAMEAAAKQRTAFRERRKTTNYSPLLLIALLGTLLVAAARYLME
jgi:hypothetical protein